MEILIYFHLFNLKARLIDFWLWWVFVAAHRLSLVVARWAILVTVPRLLTEVASLVEHRL